MADRSYNVLFLRTRNSARSIVAEAILSSLALNQGRFKAYSAGSMPATHPVALEQIARAGLPTQGLRSKAGMSLSLPRCPGSTSSSPSATTPRMKSTRCGRDSR